MRVYFLAEIPCALCVNGAFLGTVDGFERSAEVDPKDGVFCEFLPAAHVPVRFRLDETFLFSPPPQVKLYFSRGSVAIYCCDFVRADQTLTVIRQERVAGTLLTLCMQGRLQLNLENETGFHMITLPDFLTDSTFSACGDGFLLEGAGGFAYLGRDGSKRTVSDGTVLERGETLKAEIPFHDSAGHTAVTTWQNGEIISCAIRAFREPTPATFALALFESALIGADCTPYLADSLRPKAASLRAFLGAYESVVLTDSETLVGLVYARKERVYDVRYFTVELEDSKVSNIREA